MKKVSELTGAVLDYCVAKAQGYEWAKLRLKGVYENSTVYVDHVEIVGVGLYRPSSDWSKGGPIIDREKIAIHYDHISGEWLATKIDGVHMFFNGETPLIAAMRCYVASVYGDTVPS